MRFSREERRSSSPLIAISFYGITILLMVGLLIGNRFTRFVPNPDYIRTIEAFELLIGFVVFLVMAFLAFSIKTIGIGFRAKLFENPIGKIVFSGLIAVSAVIALKTVIPGLLVETMSGTEATERVRVVSVQRRGKTDCRDNVIAEWIAPAGDSTLPDHEFIICQVPSSILSGLRPGSTLVLSGYQTPLGLRVEEYRRN